MPDNDNSESQRTNHRGAKGDLSVAHQIIAQFLDDLAKEGLSEVAGRLEPAVFSEKVNEASLRSALFGEESL